MSRMTPPSPSTPSGSPDDANKRPATGANPAAAGRPGMPAQKPNVTTPKAPEMGASAPPTAGGQPANKVVSPGGSGTPARPAGSSPMSGSAPAAKPVPGAASAPGAKIV